MSCYWHCTLSKCYTVFQCVQALGVSGATMVDYSQLAYPSVNDSDFKGRDSNPVHAFEVPIASSRWSCQQRKSIVQTKQTYSLMYLIRLPFIINYDNLLNILSNSERNKKSHRLEIKNSSFRQFAEKLLRHERSETAEGEERRYSEKHPQRLICILLNITIT